ncbi:hypothetical protein GV819_25545 [Pseudomonas sp. Fl5BN2]|uniref:hypothetical protein n=1 Tax=Pseudomonas sp. Fl5BN2 TaxID=2697652 RepID=UPI001378CF2F|nr:hypothetical protein [Pseudomonas sp. Fl5BN2]NBF05665.1 hypothetical protein [Pseudomonas sp. Fl5BN2]
MTIAQLLADFADAGVTLRRCAEELQAEWPAGSLGHDLLERLRKSKHALLHMQGLLDLVVGGRGQMSALMAQLDMPGVDNE